MSEGRDQAASLRSLWDRRVVVNATIGHPVEAVFAHLANPLRWHEFAPAVAFRQPIGDGPVRVGSRWMSTDRIGPFRVHFVDELAAVESNRRVVWLSSAPWNARVEYHCSSDGHSTRIRATYEGTLSGPLRWQVGWLPSWATHWILAQDFRRLNRLLTLQAKEARRWHERHPGPTLHVTDVARTLGERSSTTGA
jgi:Polyketide cyclase / dehydrase and lipid transport